ncbi:hypothetical protein PQX77_009233 [Marasmius sp. AFHP31]|nr:hypothetical protein PQX77_009233 [Marasmius sp. AFHP31]
MDSSALGAILHGVLKLVEAAQADVIKEKRSVFATNCVGFAGFTVLIWDHIDTFAMEVEYIWLREKSWLVYLFLVNRYLIPLGFIINLYVYTTGLPHESRNSRLCDRFVRYEGSMTMIGIGIVGLMMLIRVYSLYSKNMIVVAGVALLLALHIGINAWALTHGVRVDHKDPGIRACHMIFHAEKPWEEVLTSSTAWLPLAYDTVVLSLTLYRALPSFQEASPSREIMKRLLEDGVIYYGVILAITIVLTVMMRAAEDGLKNITAQ